MGSGWQVLGLAAQFGFTVACLLLGGAWVGHLIDEWVGSRGLFLIVGILVGLGCSLYLIYLLYRLQVRR